MQFNIKNVIFNTIKIVLMIYSYMGVNRFRHDRTCNIWHAEDIGWPPKKSGKTKIVNRQKRSKVVSLFEEPTAEFAIAA